MSTITTHVRLSDSVERQLAAVRRAIRTYIALDGLLVAVLWTLLLFWLGGMLDYFPVTLGASETPQWLRATILCLLIAGVAWALVWRAGRRLLAKLPDRGLAVLLESRFPELNNELVTAVELVGKQDRDVANPTAYREMLERVHGSVSSRVGALPVAELLNWQPIYSIGVATGLFSFVSILAVVGMPTWMGMWSKRLFALSNENWPRRASLRAEGIQLQLPAFTGQLAADRVLLPFVDNTAHVPRGSAPILHVFADANAVEVPSLCTLFYRGTDGSRGRANLRRVGSAQSGWQLFTLDGPPLDGLTSDLEFDVIGSDARLRDYKLKAIEPAVVTSIELECRYPPYLLDSLSTRPASERLPYRNGLMIPEGTDVTLHGIASHPLKLVQYVMRGTESSSLSADGSTVQVLVCQPIGTQFAIPFGVLRDSLVVELRLLDRFGLSADQIPRYLLNITQDSVPEVATRLVGIGTAVTANAMIPVNGSVKDDHGVARLWTELSRDELEPMEIDLPLSLDGNVQATIDLQQLAEQRGVDLKPKTSLGLIVSALDHYDLDGKQHVGSSQPQQLAVVSPDDLVIILDRQELELRQRLEMIIEEIGQLREALRELSKLKPDATGAVIGPGRTPISRVVTRTEPEFVRSRLDEVFSSGDSHSGNRQLVVSDTRTLESIASLPLSTGLATSLLYLQAADPDKAADEAVQQLLRLASLRAQQSVLQADKSQQELLGIANRIDDIRQQLVNNRIDSRDRQERLQKRVFEPLTQALGNEVVLLQKSLGELQTATVSLSRIPPQALAAIEAVDKLLVALEQIKANMMDIESFNEMLDLVRGLLEDEERLLEATQSQQKKQVLDILNNK